jgi:hypothetical protein
MMVSLGFSSNCNFNPLGLSGWVAMTNLQTRQGEYLRKERKPPLNVRAVQRLYHSRQGDYLAKDDVSISKQVEVVSRSNGNFIDCDDLGE